MAFKKAANPIEKSRKVTDSPGLPDGFPIFSDADRVLVRVWLANQTPLTRLAYTADAKQFFEHVKKPLGDCEFIDVQGYISWLVERGYKTATRARKIASVKSLCAFGMKLGSLTRDPALLAQVPVARDQLQERIVSEAAVVRMFDKETDPRNKLILRVLYNGGLRISELCGLTWGDLKPRGKGGELTIFGKGQKTRTVSIGPNLWREVGQLRERAAASAPVFKSRHSGHLDPAQVHRLVKRAAKRVGLPDGFSAHWLRHAHASHALDAGANVHEVQKTLGHASLNTTTRYTHARRSSSDFLPD